MYLDSVSMPVLGLADFDYNAGAMAVFELLTALRADAIDGIHDSVDACDKNTGVRIDIIVDIAYKGELSENTKLSLAFQKLLGKKARVFQDLERNYVVIEAVSSKFRTVQAYAALLTPALLPNLFKDKPLTDYERAKLKYIEEAGGTEAISRCITEWQQNKEIQRLLIRKTFRKFKFNNQDKLIRELERVIENYTVQAKSYLDMYNSMMDKKEQEMARLFGIRAKEETGQNEELMDLFSNTQGLVLRRCSNESLSFTYETKLVNFEPEYFYYSGSNEMLKMVLPLIFSENPVFAINISQDFDLGMPSYHKCYKTPNSNKGICNPHLTFYECFGTAGPLLYDALRMYDIVSAVQICMNAASSMNLTDPHPYKRLCETLLQESQMKSIYNYKTKENITLTEAYQIAKEMMN